MTNKRSNHMIFWILWFKEIKKISITKPQFSVFFGRGWPRIHVWKLTVQCAVCVKLKSCEGQRLWRKELAGFLIKVSEVILAETMILRKQLNFTSSTINSKSVISTKWIMARSLPKSLQEPKSLCKWNIYSSLPCHFPCLLT